MPDDASQPKQQQSQQQQQTQAEPQQTSSIKPAELDLDPKECSQLIQKQEIQINR